MQPSATSESDAMNTMSYRGYSAVIQYDDEDGLFFGRLAGIRDGVGFHGQTVDELRAAFREAVDDYIDTCAKIGKSPQRPYSGQIMVRVDPQVHAAAALAAELSGKSLAKWTEEKLRDAAAREARAGWSAGHPLHGRPTVGTWSAVIRGDNRRR